MVKAGSVLLVATGGGHLAELESLSARVVPEGWDRAWVVPHGDQGRELRERGERVHPVRPTPPRDLAAVALNLPALRRALASERPVALVSTGAALALGAFALARARGIEAHYIESAARTEGPSLTGRLLRPLPGVHLYTQWPEWSGRRWAATGSVFDGFTCRREAQPRPVRKVVVTVGTQTGYGFRRLVARLAPAVPDGVEVLWQLGSTDASGLGIEGVAELTPTELAAAMASADAVVAHAGIGSALTALRSGHRPVLVARRAALGEHVDDHQSLIGSRIADHDLASAVEADQVRWADVEEAASWRVDYTPPGRLTLAGRLGAALGPHA